MHAMGDLQGDFKKNDMNQFIVFYISSCILVVNGLEEAEVGAERLDKDLMQ